MAVPGTGKPKVGWDMGIKPLISGHPGHTAPRREALPQGQARQRIWLLPFKPTGRGGTPTGTPLMQEDVAASCSGRELV